MDFEITTNRNFVPEITDVLQTMILEFQLQPTVQMLRHFVIPYMRNNDGEMLSELLSYQVDSIRAANAILMYILEKNEIRKAIKFSESSFGLFCYENL